MVFDTKIMHAHQVLERTLSLATKYHRFDTANLSVDALAPWKSRAAFTASWRVLFISWEPPPSVFVKVNFDGNVKIGKGGAGFVIHDPNARL